MSSISPMRSVVFSSFILNLSSCYRAPSSSSPMSLHTSLMAYKFYSISGFAPVCPSLRLPVVPLASCLAKRASLPPPPRIVSFSHTSLVSFFWRICCASTSDVISSSFVFESNLYKSKPNSTPSSYSSRSSERMSLVKLKCSSSTAVVLKLPKTK